jgi:hypothetical protein
MRQRLVPHGRGRSYGRVAGVLAGVGAPLVALRTLYPKRGVVLAPNQALRAALGLGLS